MGACFGLPGRPFECFRQSAARIPATARAKKVAVAARPSSNGLSIDASVFPVMEPMENARSTGTPTSCYLSVVSSSVFSLYPRLLPQVFLRHHTTIPSSIPIAEHCAAFDHRFSFGDIRLNLQFRRYCYSLSHGLNDLFRNSIFFFCECLKYSRRMKANHLVCEKLSKIRVIFFYIDSVSWTIWKIIYIIFFY